MQKKRSFFRISSIVLATLLVVSLTSTTYAAKDGFRDVAEGDWFYDYAMELNEAGVFAGYPDGTFRPGEETTAGEALRLVLSAAGWPDQKAADAHWASGYLRLCLQQGYLRPGEVTNLDAPVNRLLIARVAAAALKLEAPKGVTPFADTNDPAVVSLFEAGVPSGSFTSGGIRVYDPNDAINRAEVSSVIWHIYRYREPVLGKWAKGVDVSEHNGEIDWGKVAADGIEYAIIRVGYRGYTEGKLHLDERFAENLAGARAAGLKVGVYFFSQAINAKEAVEEAELVLDALDGVRLDLPITFDWEPFANHNARTDDITTEELHEIAEAFCIRIEQAGAKPMIYFFQKMAELWYDLDRLEHYDFWYANYDNLFELGRDVRFWQYSSTGKVDGIVGNVDLNWHLG